MEIERLEKWLEDNGWAYTIESGAMEIRNAHYRTVKKCTLSTVESSTLQNLLLSHFLEACYRLDGEGWE